jgi:hypothetical protein
MIKQQHKLDGKENGIDDFKAVQNMRDADFVRFLGWPQPSPYGSSPTKAIAQAKSRFSANESSFAQSNAFQSPASSRPGHAFNPK